MKHILPAIITISALLLCACETQKEPKNTEPTDTFSLSVTQQETEETAAEELAAVSQTEITASKYDELIRHSDKIDSLKTNWDNKNIGLYFSGSRDGDIYNGTLAIKTQQGYDEPSVCIIFEDESFTMSSPETYEYAFSISENGFLNLQTNELLIFRRISNGQTHIRLFEIEKNGKIIPISITPDEDHSDIFINGNEFISESFNFSLNSYVNFNDNIIEGDKLNEYALICYDYGENRYFEWLVDLDTDTAQISGSLDYYIDDDITAAVENVWKTIYLANGQELSFDHTYEQYLTYMEKDDEREETYYRISPELAGSREELIALLREPFTENGADLMHITDEGLFGGDEPVFMEDEEGLIYASAYRGVPVQIEADTVRVLSSDESSAHAIAYGSCIDGFYMKDFLFVRENGEWKLDTISNQSTPIGTYLGSKSLYAFDQWLHLSMYFNPFEIKAGEDFTVKISTVHSGKDISMARDESGNVIICRFEKAEDFKETDLARFYTENAELQAFTMETYEEEFTFNLPESGKYIFWAGGRYVSEEGETADLIAGPQIVHVK